MQPDDFTIYEKNSLKDALKKISANNHNVVLVVDEKKVVSGMVTDGDIRNCLLQGYTIDNAVGDIANRDFISASTDTPREFILKQLDHHIRVIPILDNEQRFVEMVSREYFPLPKETTILARARAPARISFGGGGSDVTYYFADDDGAVINTAINMYSHGTLRQRDDTKVKIQSSDLRSCLEGDSLDEVVKQSGSFGLIQAILKIIKPEYGFELYLDSDFPINSGLGGSAVVSTTVLGCFNQFRRDKWNRHELAELAFQAERLSHGIAGGWQDQYASVFGGFNFMEFRMDQNIVHPLRVQDDVLLELEESLILVDTHTRHNSSDIHHDQKRTMRNTEIRQQVRLSVDLTYKMRNLLLKGQLVDFGKCMDQIWRLKRTFGSKITNTDIDELYDSAIDVGALGGKLLGAGGGGFLVFFVPPVRRLELIEHFESQKLTVKNFQFETKGLSAWTVRDEHD